MSWEGDLAVGDVIRVQTQNAITIQSDAPGQNSYMTIERLNTAAPIGTGLPLIAQGSGNGGSVQSLPSGSWTLATNGPSCTFIAPPSGSVQVNYGMYISPQATGIAGYAGLRITPSGGSSSDPNGPTQQCSYFSGYGAAGGNELLSQVLTGLTPGLAYTLQGVVRSNANNGNVYYDGHTINVFAVTTAVQSSSPGAALISAARALGAVTTNAGTASYTAETGGAAGSFVAPSTGVVQVLLAGYVGPQVNNQWALLGLQTQISGGAWTDPPDDSCAVQTYENAGAATAGNGGSTLYTLTGLTPGATYSFRTAVKANTAGNIYVANRRVEIYAANLTSTTINAVTWTTLITGNSWTTYSSAFEPPGYTKINGQVHVRGLVKGGTSGTVVGVLPVGYRPAYTKIWSQSGGGAFAELRVQSDGSITFTGNNSYSSIDCTFPAEA